jgi:hypothetical protein
VDWGRQKNTQQTTLGDDGSHNIIQISHPWHPLAGQAVEVVRPYRRKDDQTYWDISLPDGTRSFLPQTWTLHDQAPCSPALTELDAQALLNLARMVAQLRGQSCQKGAPCDEQPASTVEGVLSRKSAASDPLTGRSQPETTPQPSGEQP